MPAVFAGCALLIAVLRSEPLRHGSRRYVALVGFVFGLAFMAPLIWWMNAVSAGAYVALTLAQTVFFAGVALALRSVLRLRWWPLWGAAVWLAFEYLRSSIPFSGFPWGKLAYPAADSPLASYARLLGIPATSAVTFVIAALLVIVLSRTTVGRRLGAAVTIAALVAIGALLPTGLAGQTSTKQVALIQGGVPGVFGIWPRGEIFTMHLDETQQLADAIDAGEEPQPDFVLWPENGTDIDPYDRPIAARKIEALSRRCPGL